MNNDTNNEKTTQENTSSENKSPLSAALKAALDALLNAKVKDIVAFTQELSKEAGIDLSSIATGPASQNASPVQEEEKTEFTVSLSEVGPNKIKVIQAVKALTGLGLMESKTLVETDSSVIKKDVKKDEAEKIKQDLEAVGAKVKIS